MTAKAAASLGCWLNQLARMASKISVVIPRAAAVARIVSVISGSFGRRTSALPSRTIAKRWPDPVLPRDFGKGLEL
jgi:hypothetical protein